MKATVEVRPSIELGAYRGVEVARPPAEVTEEDVERSLEALARERATLVPAERAARLGDVVTVDYEGKVDDEPVRGRRGSHEVIELDEGRFIPGFAAGIVGMRPGESKEIEARFPDDYPAAGLAGKAADLYGDAARAQRARATALDDDFAKAVSREPDDRRAAG